MARGYLARKLFKHKIKKRIAIQTIQYNARIFVELQNWRWWKLYSSVKPLLGVRRVDESIKTLHAQLSEQQSKYEEQLTENQKLVESIQSLQSKIDKLKRELESSKERNLYLETLNQEMELIVKERDADIARLSNYLDRFCTLFKSLPSIEGDKSPDP